MVATVVGYFQFHVQNSWSYQLQLFAWKVQPFKGDWVLHFQYLLPLTSSLKCIGWPLNCWSRLTDKTFGKTYINYSKCSEIGATVQLPDSSDPYEELKLTKSKSRKPRCWPMNQFVNTCLSSNPLASLRSSHACQCCPAPASLRRIASERSNCSIVVAGRGGVPCIMSSFSIDCHIWHINTGPFACGELFENLLSACVVKISFLKT